MHLTLKPAVEGDHIIFCNINRLCFILADDAEKLVKHIHIFSGNFDPEPAKAVEFPRSKRNRFRLTRSKLHRDRFRKNGLAGIFIRSGHDKILNERRTGRICRFQLQFRCFTTIVKRLLRNGNSADLRRNGSAGFFNLQIIDPESICILRIAGTRRNPDMMPAVPRMRLRGKLELNIPPLVTCFENL